MKKIIAFTCAIVTLMACNKMASVSDNATENNNQEIKVNFTVNRADIDGNTKASVKNAWADGDAIFLFFCEKWAPQCLKMTYSIDPETKIGTWSSEALNGFSSANLNSKKNNKLTAIYLPYGSDRTVYNAGSAEKPTYGLTPRYYGAFYKDYSRNYTWNAETSTLTVSVTLSLIAETGDPTASACTLVHFDISDFEPGHSYSLQQEYLKPVYFSRVKGSGQVVAVDGLEASPIDGYEDGSFLSFSGEISSSVLDNATDYTFILRDNTSNKVYSREVKDKTITGNTFISLGSIGSNWVEVTPALRPVFSVAYGTTAEFAPANLVYSNGTFSFHTNPYDCTFTETGIEVTDIYTSSGTFDLFAWGTSGWDGYGKGRTGYQPYSWNASDDVFGPAWSDSSHDLTGDYAQGDWGVFNSVSGKSAGYWTTPTKTQWQYVLSGRAASTVNGISNARYVKARIKTNDDPETFQNGLILLPDLYEHPDVPAFASINTATANFDANTYTIAQWDDIAAKGAVFLPASGSRAMNSGETAPMINDTYNVTGRYWCSTASTNDGKADYLNVSSTGIALGTIRRRVGNAVRLIHIITE